MARRPSATESIRAVVKQTVGPRENVAGMVAVVVDEDGARTASYGSSGVANSAMAGDSVCEVASITKVLNAIPGAIVVGTCAAGGCLEINFGWKAAESGMEMLPSKDPGRSPVHRINGVHESSNVASCVDRNQFPSAVRSVYFEGRSAERFLSLGMLR